MPLLLKSREALKKIVFQQAKELSELVVTNNPTHEKETPPTTDADSLFLRVRQVSTDGSIVFDPCGPFHEFVLRVEDSVLHNLLHFCDGQPMDVFTKYFADAASELDLADVVYSSTAVGSIRLCIRAIASKEPDMLIENVDRILKTISISFPNLKILKRNTLRQHAKSLANMKGLDISYSLFDDDPFAGLGSNCNLF